MTRRPNWSFHTQIARTYFCQKNCWQWYSLFLRVHLFDSKTSKSSGPKAAQKSFQAQKAFSRLHSTQVFWTRRLPSKGLATAAGAVNVMRMARFENDATDATSRISHNQINILAGRDVTRSHACQALGKGRHQHLTATTKLFLAMHVWVVSISHFSAAVPALGMLLQKTKNSHR